MASSPRIVSLISSATEILYLIGAGERVVGVSHECDYPSDITGKPRLTRSLVDSSAASRAIDERVKALSSEQSALYAIDEVQLAALAPDLVITQAQCDVCAVRYEDVVSAVERLPALRQTRVLALNPQSCRDVLDDVVRVAEAIGDPLVIRRASQVKDELGERVRSVQAMAVEAARRERPRVIALEWIDPPIVAANWMPELVAMAGGEPGVSKAGQHSTYAAWRAIVDYDPQVVVIMPCGFDLARAIVESQTLAARPGWPDLSAVREGRVFAVDGNAYFNRSGPRLVDSLEILAHLFHPDRFGPPVRALGAWRKMETRAGQLVGG